jgi:putative membrane protein
MHWKTRLVLAVLITVLACGGDDDGGTREQAQRPAAQRDTVRQPVYPEAEAAQILRAINAGEVAASRIARERSQNLDILRYARVMISDHTAMTQLLDSIVPAISDSVNPVSRTLSQEAAQLADTLRALEGGFNNTYIQTQVAAHEQALLLLDTALIPSARNPQLKKLLQDLRPAMVAHLQRARQIWAERQASGLAASTARPAPARSQQPTSPPAQSPTPSPVQPSAPPVQREDTVFAPPPTSTTNM